MSEDFAIPPLRNELKLTRGENHQDGSPMWVLHDPVRNRFYNLGWKDYEILSRWNLGIANKILATTNAQTALNVDVEYLKSLFGFIQHNHLISAPDIASIERLSNQASHLHKSLWHKALHSYLFFRIPIVRPDSFLERTYPFVAPLFSKTAFVLLFTLGLLGGYLTIRQWDQFTNTFSYVFSFEGIFVSLAILAMVKVVHELAHAYTAKRYGCRVPTMGIAFIVAWPVLYTDTTEAWKIPLRKPRIAIASAGVIAELGIAVVATFLWHFLPDGPMRSAMALLASVTWVASLAVNLNPFMRFDGYFLFADAIGVANLQPRSFALARWKMREALFAWNHQPPERLPAHLQTVLIGYAYATWIYRLFLYVAIALLVYHFVFKLGGIVLLAVELGWFVALPIYQEMKIWWKGRSNMHLNIRTSLNLALVGGLILALFLPWPVQITAPGIFQAAIYKKIFSPIAARLDVLSVQEGQVVRKGDQLAVLSSAKLDHELFVMQNTVDAIHMQIDRTSSQQDTLEDIEVAKRRLLEANTALEGFKKERNRLTLTAQNSGIITQVDESLVAGRWLDKQTPLMAIVDGSSGFFEAYVSEHDLYRVRVGQKGRFYPESVDLEFIKVRVESVDNLATHTLARLELASVYGGPIGATEINKRLVPNEAVYRIKLLPLDRINSPKMRLRGTVFLKGDDISLAARAWNRILGVLIRESGF